MIRGRWLQRYRFNRRGCRREQEIKNSGSSTGPRSPFLTFMQDNHCLEWFDRAGERPVRLRIHLTPTSMFVDSLPRTPRLQVEGVKYPVRRCIVEPQLSHPVNRSGIFIQVVDESTDNRCPMLSGSPIAFRPPQYPISQSLQIRPRAGHYLRTPGCSSIEV